VVTYRAAQALLDLVKNPDYQPMVVFPSSYAGPEREVLNAPPSGKPPLFIMLDGTWPEARKMFRKSPWLDGLPLISVDLARVSAYSLREVHAEGQYCTRKWRLLYWISPMTPVPPPHSASISPVSVKTIWQENHIIRATSQPPAWKTVKLLLSSSRKEDRYESAWAGSTSEAKIYCGYWRFNEATARRIFDDENLLAGGFAGPVLPVTPAWKAVLGVLAWPTIESLPFSPDLAVLCTHAGAILSYWSRWGKKAAKPALFSSTPDQFSA
jgi:hypothetical protein